MAPLWLSNVFIPSSDGTYLNSEVQETAFVIICGLAAPRILGMVLYDNRLLPGA